MLEYRGAVGISLSPRNVPFYRCLARIAISLQGGGRRAKLDGLAVTCEVERRLGGAHVSAETRTLLPSSACHGIAASLLCSSVARRRSRRRTTPFVNQQREGLCQPASSSAAREVVSWGHPNYPSNNPELPPNNPQRSLKYPSRTLRNPSELHHNYPPTTPQLHPNNPKPPIKTTSAMYQVPSRQAVLLTR